MIRKSIRFAFLALCTFNLFSYADCPSFVKKNNPILAPAAQAPAGFMVYNKLNSSSKELAGVYTTPINSFSEKVIPSTETDPPTNIDMTWDSKWIVYLSTATRKIYIVRVDGTGKTEVPVTVNATGFPRSTGFWHDGRRGLEIFYTASQTLIKSVSVTLPETGPATFGTSESLVFLNRSPWVFDYASFYAYQCANKRHFVTQLICTGKCGTDGKEIRRFGFFTLPMDSGSVATMDSMYTFKDMPDTSIYGCGFALSADAKMVLANPGSQGDPICVPNRESHLDHKGFMIEPFKEVSDSAISVHDIINDEGISVNWAPTSYRFGLHYEVDFSNWNFIRGSESYVSGTLTGAWAGKDFVRGLWVVNWKENAWYQVSNTNLVSTSAIAAFTAGDPIKHPLRAHQNSYTVSTNVKYYSLTGRRINPTGMPKAFTPPRGVIIRVAENKALKAIQ